MPSLELFPKDKVVGVFRGFKEGGLEFKADLILPYQENFQTLPMHGQFLLVQLENPEEAVLGRITSLSSEGKLSAGSGEEFNIRAVQEEREIPDDLRKQYLRYKINIRVLGVVRNDGNKIRFAASHRRLPHVGSPVAFPSDEVLREIVGHNKDGAVIGHFALGEFIYSGESKASLIEDWMQIVSPEIKIKFHVSNLVSRRTFVFARAGFGKSNLNKLLFSMLYEVAPKVKKRNKEVPVGTILFDPDGEYFWPDDKGRPGLCDVPHLKNNLAVFTNRRGPSEHYNSFVVSGIRLDIRRLRPSDVISIALPAEKQDQQNVNKLRNLSSERWERLVNLVDGNRDNVPQLEEMREILNLADDGKQDMEAMAAWSNMTLIIRMLHDRSSQMLDILLRALSDGKLCIVDVSQMRGNQALILSGILLRKIFDRNQQEFTQADPKTIPTIAVVEEAQSVLSERASGSAPYIEWVKEGRKYDLGALLITQQPGSIPVEILSQGDNWFLFHLLSAADLGAAKSANAHFSQDILSSLLNEPIRGQGVFWSSVQENSFPVPLRVLSFEKMFSPIDAQYNMPAADCYASKLKAEFQKTKEQFIGAAPAPGTAATLTPDNVSPGEAASGDVENAVDVPDILERLESGAINTVKADITAMDKIRSQEGIAWGALMAKLKAALPANYDEKEKSQISYALVPKFMNSAFGSQHVGWHTYRNTKGTTYIKSGAR